MKKAAEIQEKVIEIYDFLVENQRKTGIIPSVREILTAFNIKSTSSVFYYLRKMEQMGLVVIHNNKSRGIELVDKNALHSDLFVDLKVLGSIAAGTPKFAEENILETLPIPRFMAPKQSAEYFMLKVEGSSMIEAGINDGDLIVVKSQETAENGQIVVALTESENATVKRYFRESDGKICLKPENKNFHPFYPREIRILGIVSGLLRTQIA